MMKRKKYVYQRLYLLFCALGVAAAGMLVISFWATGYDIAAKCGLTAIVLAGAGIASLILADEARNYKILNRKEEIR